MLGILIGAAVLGLVIAVMEQDDFPGWGPMVLCALAAAVPTFLLQVALPPQLAIVAPLGGALVCALAISRLCGMTLQRSFIAAGIYFGVQVLLGIGCALLFASE